MIREVDHPTEWRNLLFAGSEIPCAAEAAFSK
jgi:hypothetical protein